MSDNRVNQPYRIQGSRVYGNGQSYNLHNKVTAEQLHCTLNRLTETQNLSQNIEQQYDQITKQIIQLKLSVNTLREEVNKLEDTINDLKTHNRQ